MEYLLPQKFQNDRFYNIINDKINTFFIPEEKMYLKTYIDNIVNNYLPNMVSKEQKIISVYTTIILIFISYKFNIEEDDLDSQVIMNNNRNIIGIINMLLPYLDDKNNYENQKTVTSITNIIEDVIKTNVINENPVKFCNYIFDHNIQNKMERKINDIITGDTIKITDSKHKMNKFEKEDNLTYIYDHLLFFILDTIQNTGYKLYINWINIFPIGTNYIESDVYKNSFKFNKDSDIIEIDNTPLCWFRLYTSPQKQTEEITYINNYIKKYKVFSNINGNDFWDLSYMNMFNYKGVNVCDIYNTFVNDYFSSIKKQKWLIFEFKDDSINLVISILNNLLDLSNIINQNSWDELNLMKQDKFVKKFQTFIKTVKLNSNLNNMSSMVIKKTFITLISRFYLNYIYISNLIKKKQLKKIKENLLVNDNIEYESKGIENIDIFISSISDLEPKHIYEYLFLEIGYVINTPYNNILFEEDNNGIKKLKEEILIKITDEYSITPKNYYNFGKSLSFDEDDPQKNKVDREYLNDDDKRNRLSYLWDGLSIRQKDLVCLRLNTNKDNQDWFKITKILGEIYGYNSNKANRINSEIYGYFRRNLIDLTFINLVGKGCMSYFKFNPKVSDEKILTDDYFTKKNILDKNMRKYSLSDEQIEHYNNNCYYYPNNKKFGFLDNIIRPIKGSNKTESLNYFQHLREIIKRGDTWYTFYAMDWICQIDFFNKFINHRVLYVTGSTGQGKSSQIPKLVLYGLKSFYYKNSGKAICTQPRVAPTTGNTDTISSSMGLPIKNFNNHYGENVRSLNGIVQYKYADDSHIDVSKNYFLRMVTDGTLLVDIKNSPTLKKTSMDEDNSRNDKDITVTEENLYDVVMIDEAHEHNVNMDIILSLCRNSLLYNNDIKLLIISATMDDDEPTYRSYYRYIDDNLSYPTNINTLQLGLSKNLVDRRFHISPPGKTTQHVVNDYYVDSSPDTYFDNEKLGIDKCVNIFKTTSFGDILFFSTTQNKIINICNKLNSLIPTNCICLPYFANMPRKYFDMVTNIHANIGKINFDKKYLLPVLIGDIKEEYAKKVNFGTYKRAIIVATNVAEASLTIPSLRYIVDLGYQLSVEYNYQTKISSPIEVKISESSRMQRRGRVGRVAGGNVYYMYPKQSRKYVQAKYNISIQNFSDQFLSLLTLSEEKDEEIIDVKLLNKFLKLEDVNLSEYLNLSSKKELNNYEKIIYKQYIPKLNSLDGNLDILVKTYSESTLLSNFIDWLLPSYKTGISQRNLLDTCGNFHIIHPFEGNFIRDPLTRNTINQNTYEVEHLPLDEATYMIESAILNLDLVKIHNEDSNKFFKTEINILTEFFAQKFKIYDMREVKSLISSYILEISDEFLFCNSCFEIVEGKIEGIIDIGSLGRSKTYSNFIEKNKQDMSDINLFLDLSKYLFRLIDFEQYNKIIFDKKYNSVIEVLKENKSYKDIIKTFIQKNLTIGNLDTLINLKLKGKLDEDSIIKEISSNPDKDTVKQFVNLIPNLDMLIQQKELNRSKVEDIIFDFLKKRTKYNNIILDLDKKKSIELKEKVNKFKENINLNGGSLTKTDKLTLCYLISNLDKLMMYKGNKLYFPNSSNPKLMEERDIRNFFGKNLTLLKSIYPIILQLKDDLIQNKLSHGFLFNIDKKMLLEYIPHLVITYSKFDSTYINKSLYSNNINLIQNKINLSKDSDKNSRSTTKIREGDTIQAKLKGWTKYYKGEVTRVNNNETYDIKFENGERKRGVEQRQIKEKESEAKQNDKNSDKNILNMFYNIMINKVNTQKGGMYVNKTYLKVKLSTLKKINKLYDTLDDKLKNNFDKFDFAYIHINGLDIIGIHLIKKQYGNYIQVFSSMNNYNSLENLRDTLSSKGQFVIAFDMSSSIINSKDQKAIDFALKN